MAKDLQHYLSLSYPIEMFSGEGAFFVHHPDLPGCMSQGDTADEAVANLDDAREGWLRVALEDGLPIPEPLDVDEMEYSGHISLRMTPALHAALAASARRQEVSLNQLINTVLAEYNGLVRGRAEVEQLRAAERPADQSHSCEVRKTRELAGGRKHGHRLKEGGESVFRRHRK